VNVYDATLQNGSSRRGRSIHGDWMPLQTLDEFWRVAIAGRNAINLSVLPVDQAVMGLTESDCVLHQTF
jgi:hypothetical protein